ncbi:MAG: pantetheine-phosphate adenylyltransferase [Bdellovibrionota bacterium]
MADIEKIALYPGTFDPITLGHYDVIERASRLFDQVVVAIGLNTNKEPFFNDEERIDMIEEVCKDLANVRTGTFTGLAVDYAQSINAIAIVRGLRTEADFMYEMQMAMMNRTLKKELETVFIPTRQDLSHVSSSLVKEVCHLGGNVNKLVPNPVAAKLKNKYR